MEINVDEKARTLEVWLTTSEKAEKDTIAILRPLYSTYNHRNYKITVFLSGGGDLLDNTRDLLAYNRLVAEP